MTDDSALANRIAKVQRHLKKWARRQGVSCWRVYEKDIPDQPLIVDWYDGDAVVSTFRRTRDETDAQDRVFVAQAAAAIASGLEVAPERVHVRRRAQQKDRQSGQGQYSRLAEHGATKVVSERDLKFEVNVSDYLDTGLFLDHRDTRQLVRAECRDAVMLNLFAYTGAFTVAAAKGGARATTTVDLSNTYLDWAGRNLALNGIERDAGHRLVRADANAFLTDAVRRALRFDRIVCDPPTFSNSAGMEHDFVIERDHPALIERCIALLPARGMLWFSSNQRGFALNVPQRNDVEVKEITAQTVPEDFKGRLPHRCWKITRIA